jgi:hypothetical protein
MRRVLVALGISLAMVVVLAALIPRVYLANDDVGFTDYLRRHEHAPWMSPVFVWLLSSAYRVTSSVPWYGLYQYLAVALTGAVLIHTCLELMDPREGEGRSVTRLGGLVLGASHAILCVGLTWTTVSISACGAGVVGFVAHAHLCQASGQRISWVRGLVYGLVFICGYMLRPQGLMAVAVALAPLFVWTLVRFARRRYLPRLVALIAFAAPFAVVVAISGVVPAPAESAAFIEYNDERGRIHGNIAFDDLENRAPELITRAGWTLEEFRDFMNWRYIDEADFPLDKVKRLAATGGSPQPMDLARAYRQLREIVDDSTAAVLLFMLVIGAIAALSWLEVIDRRSGLVFGLAYLVFVIVIVVWIAARFRFPQRVSLSFFGVAAFGAYVYLARAIADRAGRWLPRDSRTLVALAMLALLAFGWARELLIWIDRKPWPHSAELLAFEERVAARKGFIFIVIQAGQVHHDPLRAVTRGYDGLAGSWGTFATSWYAALAPLGVHRGADVFPAMVDNPDAYVMSTVAGSAWFEDWIRRKLRKPALRLALVDAAAITDGSRPELYRVVTTPLTPGTEEWRALGRRDATLATLLPGPPATDDLGLQPFAFRAPYEQYTSSLRDAATGITTVPIENGLRVETTGAPSADCAAPISAVRYAGAHVPVTGLGAARFAIKLLHPENITGLHVDATTATSRSIRWHWGREHSFDFDGTLTVVPHYPAHQLQLVASNARPSEVVDLHIVVAVKPGTRAGFELRDLELAAP